MYNASHIQIIVRQNGVMDTCTFYEPALLNLVEVVGLLANLPGSALPSCHYKYI